MRFVGADLPFGENRQRGRVTTSTLGEEGSLHLAARIDSIVTTDILPRGFPSVAVVVTRAGNTMLERASGVTGFTARQNGVDRELRKVK